MDTDILRMCIMHKDIILSDTILTDSHHPQTHSIKNESLIPILSKNHLFSMTKNDRQALAMMSLF